MSIRPCLGAGVPELTARVARASNPAGTTAMWVRDRLDGLWDDEDFAGWYSRDGRPGISPAQLATVSVLQFLLDLSDRDAAEAVRCRIDFKYALGLDLDDPGFHHSVLSDFRDRLLEDGRADRLLDLALARLKEAWLVRERTSQRTDSTHVLAAVRDLTRLELVTEAVRAALEEVARTAGHALEGLAGDDWGRRYGRPVRLDKNPTRPKTRMNDTGADARLLLEHLAASFTACCAAPAAARQPHPPAPRPAGLRPRRLPHRLRPPGGHLPAGPGQQRVARPLPDLLARRRPAHRRPLHQGPVPALSRQGRLHHLRRRQAHRGLPPARTARTADPQPRRPARPRLAQALRRPVRHRGHRLRARPRPQHAPLPLPRPAQGPPPARAHRHRRQHRTPQPLNTPGENTSPRPPTAFQKYLDQHDIQRLRSWRAVS